MKSFKCIFFVLIIGGAPALCLAQDSFVISEITMNPEGSDSGREWIEVVNLGAGTGIDGYKFKEGSTSTKAVSHGLKIPEGQSQSWLLDRNEAFVIADNPEKFFLDYPEYNGKIFDSSFSLTNSGEYLAFLDDQKNTLFEITVTEDLIPDEGNSLCLVENIWKQCRPSPGMLNTESEVVSGIVAGGEDAGAEGASSESETTDDPNPNQGFEQPVVQQTYIEIKNPDYREKVIKADGGGDRVILAGSEFLFEAKSYGLLGNPLKDPKYRWNFGDGKTEKGQKALHVYHHPGEYTATLSAKTERFTHVDKFKIKVIEPDLEISEVSKKEGYIEIKNNTKHNLDISFFQLESKEIEFEIPENTFIDSGSILIFPEEHTEIVLVDDFRIRLQTPNGKNIDVFEMSVKVENEIEAEKEEKTETVKVATPVSSVKKAVSPGPPPKVPAVQSVTTKVKAKEIESITEVEEKAETTASSTEQDRPILDLDNVQAASVLTKDNQGFKYLYEAIFTLLMSGLILSAFFIKPKKKEEDPEKEIKKEAKTYEINER